MSAVELPETLRAPSSNPDEEHRLIETLGQWLARNQTHVESLLDSFSDLEPTHQRRAVRALGRLPDRYDLPVAPVSSDLDSRVIYHLIDSVLTGSNPEHCRHLETFARHDVNWVAARALETLAEKPGHNESVLRNRLREESRGPVLIALLKALRDHSTARFTDDLVDLISSTDTNQVIFYAGVLLKQSAPDRLDELADDSAYLRKFTEHVEVESPGAEEEESCA